VEVGDEGQFVGVWAGFRGQSGLYIDGVQVGSRQHRLIELDSSIYPGFQ
jgi:hypothetical protein